MTIAERGAEGMRHHDFASVNTRRLFDVEFGLGGFAPEVISLDSDTNAEINNILTTSILAQSFK